MPFLHAEKSFIHSSIHSLCLYLSQLSSRFFIFLSFLLSFFLSALYLFLLLLRPLLLLPLLLLRPLLLIHLLFLRPFPLAVVRTGGFDTEGFPSYWNPRSCLSFRFPKVLLIISFQSSCPFVASPPPPPPPPSPPFIHLYFFFCNSFPVLETSAQS